MLECTYLDLFFIVKARKTLEKNESWQPKHNKGHGKQALALKKNSMLSHVVHDIDVCR
jgi:hypothetical protein